MPKLIENVLIGDRVRLAGEDISEADAKGVRPEVFEGAEPAAEEAPAADEPKPESEDERSSSDDAGAAEEAPAADEPAKASRARGKGTSGK